MSEIILEKSPKNLFQEHLINFMIYLKLIEINILHFYDLVTDEENLYSTNNHFLKFKK